jgi:galactose-1-phosphate uridylyltransferase
MTECHDCRHNDQLLEALPTRERVFNNGLWRVAHAFSSALPGWMVVIPRRHVLSLSELTASEATSLGPLLTALSTALERGLGARKAYLAFFAEAKGFAHLHRMSSRVRTTCSVSRAHTSCTTWNNPGPVGQPNRDGQIADRLRPLLAEQVPNL